MERSPEQSLATIFSLFQSKMELVRILKTKRNASSSEKQLLELLQQWMILLQTMKDKTLRPMANLKSVNDNLKGLLTKCQLVIMSKQSAKYQNFKTQVDLIKKSIQKIEYVAKPWTYIDLEDKICLLTEKVMRDLQTDKQDTVLRSEEVKIDESITSILTVDDNQLVKEIQALQVKLREMQQDHQQLQQMLDQLNTSQVDLNIQLQSLKSLNGYRTEDVSANYEKQKQEMINLQQTLAYLQNEQAMLEDKIKEDIAKEKLTEVVYDFYFVTNPEVFQEKEVKGNFFTKLVKSVYNKVTSNQSIPAKITSSMHAIINNERSQARHLNSYSAITIDKFQPFQYRHSTINPDQFHNPAQLKFADVPHKEREQFLQYQYRIKADSHQGTQVMAVYVIYLADAYWTKRFEKFCDRLNGIDNKLVMVIDCEEKHNIHKTNRDAYERLLDRVNHQWNPSHGDILINNTVILPFTTIDSSNLSVQRAIQSHFIQCQSISIHDNYELKQLQKVNNDIVNLESQLVQLKYMAKENEHIIAVQNAINQGDKNTLSNVEEQLALVNSEIEDLQMRLTKVLEESKNTQDTISAKKQQRREIQSSLSKMQHQQKQKALSNSRYQQPQQQEIDIQLVSSEIDINRTMRPLKASFDSYIKDVTKTLEEVKEAINKIQKVCEEEDTAASEELQVIAHHIENNIMRKIIELAEEQKVIADIRI